MNLRKILVSVALLNVLVACGGSGDDDAVTADDRKVPASALVSASAYSMWAGTLTNSETDAPVPVEDGMMPPKSESEDPIGVR